MGILTKDSEHSTNRTHPGVVVLNRRITRKQQHTTNKLEAYTAMGLGQVEDSTQN